MLAIGRKSVVYIGLEVFHYFIKLSRISLQLYSKCVIVYVLNDN